MLSFRVIEIAQIAVGLYIATSLTQTLSKNHRVIQYLFDETTALSDALSQLDTKIGTQEFISESNLFEGRLFRFAEKSKNNGYMQDRMRSNLIVYFGEYFALLTSGVDGKETTPECISQSRLPLGRLRDLLSTFRNDIM